MFASIRFVEEERAWKISSISLTLDVDSIRDFLHEKNASTAADQMIPMMKEVGEDYIEL